MSRRSICALLTVGVLCSALASSNEFVAASELVKRQPPEDKLSATIARARNSSRAPYPKDTDGAGTQEYDKGFDKQPRTDTRDNCCGPRYGSNSSTRPDSSSSKFTGNSGRYPTKFGERLPMDRYGWQTQGHPAGFSGSTGSTGRPAGGTYGAAVLYEGSQAGDRFGSRPSYGSESSHKPPGYGSGLFGGYGYGNGNGNGNGNDGYGGFGFGRPPGYGYGGGGGYGISGTLANGDEFGPAEPSYPDGNPPTHPNIQAQKAVALKALAGVALIGAAAALATNPVLLPLGVVSGRRKRSNVSIRDRDAYMDYILAVLKRDATKNYSDEDGNKMTLSPGCIARLACEIQKTSWLDSRRHPNLSKRRPDLERRLDDLILGNVPREDAANMRVKKLLKAATFVASTGGNCNTFTCTFVKTKEAKTPSIFKL